MNTYTDAQIAQVCHEANRALQSLHVTAGNKSIPVSPPWWQLPEDDRVGIIAGVAGVLAGRTPEQSHEDWCENKRALGWTYAQVKNEQMRTHPCLVPYDALHAEQRRKDLLFAAIVKAMGAEVDAIIEPVDRLVHEVTSRVDGRVGCGLTLAHLPEHDKVGTGAVVNCPGCIDARPTVSVTGPLDSDNARNALGPDHPFASEARIGAIVHYVAHGTPVRADGTQAFPPACRAAMVTEDNGDGNVGLFVANPTGVFLLTADYDPGQAHSWHWTDADKLVPPALCDGQTHAGGSWHWPA